MKPLHRLRTFTKEIGLELRKTTWPCRRELKQSLLVVLTGVLLLGGFIGIVDFSLFQIVDLVIGWVR